MRNPKENRGSITIYVLISILFFIIILMGIYISVTNKQRASEALGRKNLETYEQDVNNIDSIYSTIIPSPPALTEDLSYLEGSIEDGLVVTDKNENEFVWIPVSTPVAKTEQELTSLVARGIYPLAVKTTLVSGVQNYRAVLYDFGYNATTHKVTITPKAYDANNGNREPGYLTDSTNGDANTTNNKANITAANMQLEFNQMVERITANKGFYVGRYESSYNTTTSQVESKPNKAPMTAATGNQMWWGLYTKQKALSSSTVTSHMIWGCQYDQMIIWMKDVVNAGRTQPFYVLDSTNMGNHSGTVTNTGNSAHPEYAVKNIYDLAGNVCEATVEAFNTNNRVYRGGYFSSNVASSNRLNVIPASINNYLGSRLVLY